jgi:hypothetical protein
MELQRLKFLMEVQEKIDEWSKKLPPDDTNLVKAKEQFFKLVTTEFKKTTTSGELPESPKIDKIALDTSTIRQVLELKKNISIDFNFIDNEQVKNQLITDNLRMENPRWDLPKEGVQRFHDFCVNAFYQIEELINYYFSQKFSDIESVIAFIEEQHKNRNLEEGKKNKPYIINFSVNRSKMTDISKIEIFNKLTSFLYFFKFEYIEIQTANNLRQLRNESSHRCNVILNDTLEKLNPFLLRRFENYAKIRQLIVRICEVIKKDLGK